jgi:hypothetical protein
VLNTLPNTSLEFHVPGLYIVVEEGEEREVSYARRRVESESVKYDSAIDRNRDSLAGEVRSIDKG